MMLGVCVFVQCDDGVIMLVKYIYISGWYLLGGGVECGELVEIVVEWELEEEVGLNVWG